MKGATQCFLPAYSPDLDPIEQVFAKLKNTQRKMAHRTVDVLWEGNGGALDGFAPNECPNYFATPDMALPNRDTL